MPAQPTRDFHGRAIVHVGLHKTASTLLQQAVFPAASSLYFPEAQLQLAIDAFVRFQELDFDPEGVAHLLAPHLKDAAATDRTLLVSHERLSGYSPFGAYDTVAIAERIKKVLPDIRLLVVIREQRSMILSLYAQYIQDGGCLSLREYLKPSRENVVRVPRFSARQLEYSRLLSMYDEIFGAENVFVAPLELVRREPQAFLQRCPPELHDVDVKAFETIANPRRPLTYTHLLRLINRVLVRNQLNPAGLLPLPIVPKLIGLTAPYFSIAPLRPLEHVLTKRRDATLRRIVPPGFYSRDNQYLAEVADLPLHNLGYE